MIAYAVSPKVFGTAYGMLYVSESVGVVIHPIIVGALQRGFKDPVDGMINYTIVTAYLLINVAIGILITGYLTYYDYKNGYILNSNNPKERRKLWEENKAKKKLEGNVPALN